MTLFNFFQNYVTLDLNKRIYRNRPNQGKPLPPLFRVIFPAH